MSVFAVILASGTGSRCGGGVPKQFQLLAGRPLFWHSVATFCRHEAIDRVVLVVADKYVNGCKNFLNSQNLPDVIVTAGGRTRQLSSRQGLLALQGLAAPDDCVLVHDGARPLVSAKIISACVQGVQQYGAASVAVNSTDTLYQADSGLAIAAIPERSAFYRAQTPQGFRYGEFCRAHRQAFAENYDAATDDVQLYQRQYPTAVIHIVAGEERNFKVTTAQDFQLAKLLLTPAD